MSGRQTAEALAHNVYLTVIARAMQVFGVPAGLAVMFWLFSTVASLEKEVAKLPLEIRSVIERIDATNRRLDGVEQRLQRLEQPYFERGRNP